MIIVDERQFIEKELEDKGFGIFDFYENHQVMSVDKFCELPLQRRADILIVDTQSLLAKPKFEEQFKTIINTFLGVVFIHEQKNQPAASWVQDQAAFLTKIVGEYAVPMPQLQWTMLSNQLQFFWTILEEQKALQKHLANFSMELDQVMKTAEVEMARAKKVHEVLIPKRSDEIKGVHFTNKYAAGDGGGGEFYDLHQTSQKVFQILVSSQSYLISSSLLGVLNQHKLGDFNPEAFLKDARAEIGTINSAKKKKSEVDILLMELDLSQLKLSFWGESKAELHSHLKGKVSTSTAYMLERGEKVIVFSPGFIFNWKETHPKEDPHAFVKRTHMSTSDLLSELFFHLKMDRDSEFLRKDATAVMMEVNRHGMHKV